MKPQPATATTANPRWVRRLKTAICVLAGIGFVGWFIGSDFAGYWLHSELTMQLDPKLSWQGARVQSDNFPGERNFSPASGAIRVHPIAHGYYRMDVRFSDGQTLWRQLMHADAGVRKWVNLTVTPAVGAGMVHLHLAENQGVFPDRSVLYDGDIRPSDTSKEQPVTLSGP